jgi:hypothetical protein
LCFSGRQAYEDDLPFEQFSLRVPEADIAQLPQMLKGMIKNQPEKVASMQVSPGVDHSIRNSSLLFVILSLSFGSLTPPAGVGSVRCAACGRGFCGALCTARGTYLPLPRTLSSPPCLSSECSRFVLGGLWAVWRQCEGPSELSRSLTLTHVRSMSSPSGTESGHNDAFDTLLLALRNRRDHHGVRPPSADAGADWIDAQCLDESPQHPPVAREALCMAYHPARPTAVDGAAMNIPGQSSSPLKVRARPDAFSPSSGRQGHGDSMGICVQMLCAERSSRCGCGGAQACEEMGDSRRTCCRRGVTQALAQPWPPGGAMHS